MNVKEASLYNLGQVRAICGLLDPDEYSQSLALFNGSTLGQHIRHIIEFYQAVVQIQSEEEVCYDSRRRDEGIQTDPGYASVVIDALTAQLKCLDLNKRINVVQAFGTAKDASSDFLQSSIGRELAYAHDHSVHHLAIIRMGLQQIGKADSLDRNLGVAPSSVRNAS